MRSLQPGVCHQREATGVCHQRKHYYWGFSTGRRLLPAERTPDDGKEPTTRNHPSLSTRDVLVLGDRQAERLH